MNRTWYNFELDKLVKEMKFVPYKLKKGARYQVGKTYWCAYWRRIYTVLSINGVKVKVKWEDDGEIVEHMTPLEYERDYELRPFEILEHGTKEDIIHKFIVPNCNISFTAAELKALCCVGIIDPVTISDIEYKYFRDTKYAPNDNVYYFLEIIRVNCIGERKVLLSRDLKKSPRNNERRSK